MLCKSDVLKEFDLDEEVISIDWERSLEDKNCLSYTF